MTIALEHIQDGDWAAVNRVTDTLRSLVLDTGGRSIGIRTGIATGTFAGATDATSISVTHGLGRTPAAIVATCSLRSDGSARTYASHSAVTSTTFTAFAVTTGANPAVGVTVPIHWAVIG